jgi:hypothetical protein
VINRPAPPDIARGTGTPGRWLRPTHTDTLTQTVTILAAVPATLSFWLHIDTA